MENAHFHDILQGDGIIEPEALQTIIPPDTYLEGSVVFKTVFHYAKQAYPQIKVAVLHPEFVSRYFLETPGGGYQGMELLNDNSDYNRAYNYLYGVQQGFDILLILIHKRRHIKSGEHWMIGIYESSSGENVLYVCDPVDNPLPIDSDLRNVLRHVLNTASRNTKLKGKIIKPRHQYNHQDDAYSCGVFVVFYARQYLTNRRLFVDRNFDPMTERQAIHNVITQYIPEFGPTIVNTHPSNSALLSRLVIEDHKSTLMTIQRPERASKRRSKELLSDIINDLNSSQGEHSSYCHKTRSTETNVEHNRQREQTCQRVSRYRRSFSSNLPSTYKIASTLDVEYAELGKFNVACFHDGAIHFPEERVQNKIHVDSFGDCCLHGKIQQQHPQFSNELALLFTGQHQSTKEFHRRIRNINACFSFASFKVDDDRTFNQRGIYAFTAGGQIHHKINLAAIPTQNSQGNLERPCYGQMFFLDPDDATNERSNFNQGINKELLQKIEEIMRIQNPFARAFVMMKEAIEESNQLAAHAGIEPPNVKLIFTTREGDDPNRFNAPKTNEVAAVLTLNADQSIPENEMVIHEHGKEIVHLQNVDGRVEPFTYPLFYPNGTFGFSVGLPLHKPYASRPHMTRTELARYRLAFRPEYAKTLQIDPTNAGMDLRLLRFNALHFGGRLLQQYVVDNYIRVERDRILWIKLNQKKLKAESYSGIHQLLNNLAERNNAIVGEKIILPSSFPGSTRYYAEHFEDAMAIVRRYGSPDFFITVTCNPKWPELLEAAQIDVGNSQILQQTSQERPDLVTRVCKLKFDQIIEDIDKKLIFGKAAAYVYTIEFQKRGLPHMHLLIIMASEDKIHNPQNLDDFISAEIPDDDQGLRKLVLDWMIHNPCGELNPSAQCMVSKGGKTKCRFGFRKAFQEDTSIMDDEKPKYRRRFNPLLDPGSPQFSHEHAVYRKDSNGRRVTRDNRDVAPYNAYLLKKYRCHINVEYVGSIRAVKYLYKYIYKGHDCATIKIVENQQKVIYNEPEKFVEARYISPPEACWRLFGNEIQAKSHSINRLDIHLPGQFHSNNIDQAPEDLTDIGQKGSKLEAYFRLNTNLKQQEQHGANVTYRYYWQMPEFYTWEGKTSEWKQRQRSSKTIGRIFNVNFVSQPELFHLRILLFHVKNATSFQDLLEVNGVTHSTYKQACLAMGLTFDDQQFVEGLQESASSKMPHVMRTLFAQILILGVPENPKRLWEMFKEDLAEDFIREARRTNGSIDEAIKGAYRIIAYKLNTEATEGRNFQTWVRDYGMDNIDNYYTDYNQINVAIDESAALGDRNYQLLNDEQRTFVDAVLHALEDQHSIAKCFFLDGPGGTGKTFVYTTLYHLIRGRQNIIKCMAFTGIAAILLPEGRTTHKTFGLKVPLSSESTSSIKPRTIKAKELSLVDVFMIDEAPMLPKYGLENIDQLLRTIESSNVPFGGKVVVLGGDFRQCCPVQQRANKSEIIDLSIKQSGLWQHFKVFELTKNMRVDPQEDEFARYLLKVGDGNVESNDLGEIELPEEILSNGDLIGEIFGSCLKNGNYEEMKHRAILAPLNKDKDKINKRIIEMLPGEEKSYKSFDSVKDKQEGALQFTSEFLNSVDIADVPPHELKLKKSTIIMLMRNLDVSEGLCNGTRLIVTELCNHIIKAKIITGEHSGREVHLPRITLDSSKSQLGVTMQRHQFPVTPAFAMTIHKSQGQTFEFVGVLLQIPVFMHGMLYVAFSRVKRQSALKVVLQQENPKYTRNVVWKDILTKRTSSNTNNYPPTNNYPEYVEDLELD